MSQPAGAALMQRVRIGLTGLACVFLLVVLAASLFGLMGGGDALSDAEDNRTVTIANAEAPREPLAELGVAPGGAPETTNSVQAAPAVRAR